VAASTSPQRLNAATAGACTTCVETVSLGNSARSTTSTRWPMRASSMAVGEPAQRAPMTIASYMLAPRPRPLMVDDQAHAKRPSRDRGTPLFVGGHRWDAVALQDPPDRRGADAVAEFEQLSLDPRVAPARVSPAPSAPPRRRGRRRSVAVRSGSGRSIVGGRGGDAIAGIVSGVTRRWQRSARGSRGTRAASTARSAQSMRGRGWVRRSTATSCRSTRSSTSLVADVRPSSRTSPSTCRKIKYSNRSDTLGSCPTLDYYWSATQARLLAPHRASRARSPSRVSRPRSRPGGGGRSTIRARNNQTITIPEK
jgi:hypothetical protein